MISKVNVKFTDSYQMTLQMNGKDFSTGAARVALAKFQVAVSLNDRIAGGIVISRDLVFS